MVKWWDKHGRADKVFVIFLIFSVIVQIYFFKRVQVHYYPSGFTTESYYEETAKNLASHNTFARGEYPDLELDTFRPPFFSFMLATWYKVFGVSPHSGLILNNVLLTLTIVIVFFTGRLIHPFVGLMSAIICFVDPILIVRANSNQSEIPFMFLFSASLYFLVKFLKGDKDKIIIFLFSLFFVLSTFTRVTTLYFPLIVPLIICLLFQGVLKENWKKYCSFLIIFLLVNLLAVGLWMYRNYKITGDYSFVSMKSTHFLNFIAAQAMADKEGLTRQEAMENIKDKYFNDKLYKNLNRGEKEHYKLKISRTIIIECWPEALMHYLKGFNSLFFSCPVKFISLGLSKKEFVKQQITFSEACNNSKCKGGMVNKIFTIARTLMSEGYWGFLIYSFFIKLYYLFNVFCTLIGFYVMIFIKKNIDERRIGLFLICLFSYIVLITCTWATGRLRTQILPIMGFMSAFSIYYFYLNKKKMFSFVKIINRSKGL